LISKIGKIAIVGTVGVPACYGGFETLVENLVKQDSVGVYSVFCSSKSYKQRPDFFYKARLHYIPINANGIQSILYDTISILLGIFLGYRNFLILGVSGIWIVPLLRRTNKSCKFVVNIDGVEWKREKWGWFSSKFLKFSESLAVNYCHSVVTDNEAIQKYVTNVYARKSRVIAYGGDHVLSQNPNCNTKCKSSNPFITALSICRIEPENNIHIILEALMKIGNKFRLTIIGNWDNSDYGKELKKKYSAIENIILLDPVYSPKRLNDYRSSCDIYIHGHSAGGTNPSLVEIMFYQKEIFAFDCEYNFCTMEGNGMYFRSTEDLISLLKGFKSNIRNDNKRYLLRLAQRRYTWNVVAKSYSSVFNELC
jgi:glycosyltransferase involved in cell wall biosynthesis